MMILEWRKQYKWYISGGAFVFVILLVILFLKPEGSVEVIEAVDIEAETEQNEDTEITEVMDLTVFVEVKGAVKSAGVYELPKDARVINVLDMAELMPQSDLTVVNQSQKVFDEMVIYVPYEGEDIEMNFNSEQDEGDKAGVVNINTASVTDLMTLNGIGEKKAALIIEYREINGLFMKKEDLMNISGIGEKTFESLDPYITID